ncbi:hypothetical protein SAMN05192564_104214 [Paraburkholderia sartisoli]|uniref:Uncharacterized protein n=1 Tax=Paraburkholderia sartisoli TaxID=83784 RepID=A0A1H4F9W0_9BURK|nr:hypothetical protein SAMN05192564_104214 [Paraburkholderia sartisoli]
MALCAIFGSMRQRTGHGNEERADMSLILSQPPKRGVGAVNASGPLVPGNVYR